MFQTKNICFWGRLKNYKNLHFSPHSLKGSNWILMTIFSLLRQDMEEQMNAMGEFHRWLRMCRKKKSRIKKECH